MKEKLTLYAAYAWIVVVVLTIAGSMVLSCQGTNIQKPKQSAYYER